MSRCCEQRMATVILEYRWAMALLGHAYDKKKTQIKEADQESSGRSSRSRGGRGTVRGEAVDALMRLVGLDPSSRERKAFRKRLARATRWFAAATMLGWGSLCLMPIDVVSNSWVEREIQTDAWNIWLQLVKRINPEAYSASLAFDRYVGQEGIYGGPIQGTDMLCIEENSPTVVYQIEEIADSAEEQDSDSDIEGTARLGTRKPRPLRQLSLLKWFQPQRA
jgi:hypothetical protein